MPKTIEKQDATKIIDSKTGSIITHEDFSQQVFDEKADESTTDNQPGEEKPSLDLSVSGKIGLKLREARKAARITQSQIGERLDISTAHVSALERGYNRIWMEVFVAYCEACDIDPNELLYGVLSEHLQEKVRSNYILKCIGDDRPQPSSQEMEYKFNRFQNEEKSPMGRPKLNEIELRPKDGIASYSFSLNGQSNDADHKAAEEYARRLFPKAKDPEQERFELIREIMKIEDKEERMAFLKVLG